MATKNVKSRKPITSRTKGIICLVLLLAVTAFVSCLAVRGMDLDAQGVNVLLPWVPVSSENWPASLPLNRALNGGAYTEYTYAIPEGAQATALEDSLKALRARAELYGEGDTAVTEKDGVIRMEVRNMSSDRRTNLVALATVPGQFEFTYAGEVVLTEKDITGTSIGANYPNGRLTSYVLTMNVSKEGRQKIADFGAATLTITMDGSTIGTGIVDDNKITLTMTNTTTNYNNLTTMDFLLRTGSIDVDLTNSGSGTVSATLSIVLQVVLWVSVALLALTLIYTVVSGKLTGISATISVWCAVVLGLFLVATVVVPTLNSLSVGCLVAILMGILLAVYTAVTRTDAISKQIGEGASPKSATKVGFRTSAKAVWIAHGAVLVIALILMIFSFSRGVGYCLSAGVLASAIAVLAMRLFQACFTSISNKPSLFGKAK